MMVDTWLSSYSVSIKFVSAEDIRQGAWDNIVTCHQGVSEVRTWSFQRKSIGKHHLKSQADAKCGPVMV